ncbi:class I SAM-dependent methyltransferase [Synechococcus sp. PCC 7336]|uniref:class I SAM-dependent methyltransferase n=1 Tax=Synechococcus sp. PCC 7336 TaxID=195250 RepID=UPI0003485D6E|nr:class I SAM-dependent methyltransferase [Synechococcus sp. PCC 7336]
MTVAVDSPPAKRTPLVRLVNGLLAIQPLYNWARQQARDRMIRRAESMGVAWRDRTAQLKAQIGPQALGTGTHLSPEWASLWQRIRNPNLAYPNYYQSPFHAYPAGNLSWDAATEVEVAAYAVHAGIWPDAGVEGDARMRAAYHDIVAAQLPTPPVDVLDLGCSVGMSTFALQDRFPTAAMTGLDLSPYFLAVAQQRADRQQRQVRWHHAAAEATGLPDNSYDLVSLCLVCHELPSTASRAVFAEAHRLLRPGGHLALMDMNPDSEVHRNMPAFVLTLLKSTEPFLDDYFSFDIASAIAEAGFETPHQEASSPRHRTLVARCLK